MIMTRSPPPAPAAPASPVAHRVGPRASPLGSASSSPGAGPPRRSPRAPAPGPELSLRVAGEARRGEGGRCRRGARWLRERPEGRSPRRAGPGDRVRGGGARGSRSPLHRPQPLPPLSRRLCASPAKPRGRGEAAAAAARPHRTALRPRRPAHVAKPPVRSGGSAPRLPTPVPFASRGTASSVPPKRIFKNRASVYIRGRIGNIESVHSTSPFPRVHLEPRTPRHTRTRG